MLKKKQNKTTFWQTFLFYTFSKNSSVSGVSLQFQASGQTFLQCPTFVDKTIVIAPPTISIHLGIFFV